MRGNGWSENFNTLLWAFLLLIFFGTPIAVVILALRSDPTEGNWLVLILVLLVIYFVITGYYGLWEHTNKLVRFFIYVPMGIFVLVFLRIVYLYIRDTFAKDTRSGMAELLAIPVGVVVYGVVIWLLPVGLSESARKRALLAAKVVTISVISLLVYLIDR